MEEILSSVGRKDISPNTCTGTSRIPSQWEFENVRRRKKEWHNKPSLSKIVVRKLKPISVRNCLG